MIPCCCCCCMTIHSIIVIMMIMIIIVSSSSSSKGNSSSSSSSSRSSSSSIITITCSMTTFAMSLPSSSISSSLPPLDSPHLDPLGRNLRGPRPPLPGTKRAFTRRALKRRAPMGRYTYTPNMKIHMIKRTKGVPTSVSVRVRTWKESIAKHDQTSCYLRPPFLETPLVPSRRVTMLAMCF